MLLTPKPTANNGPIKGYFRYFGNLDDSFVEAGLSNPKTTY